MQIELTDGKYAEIDEIDWDLVHWYKWFLVKGRDTYYARAYIKGSGRENQRRIYMHRLILNVPDDVLVDHRDGNGLMNRRYNLRLCSNTENAQNTPGRPGHSSQFKGVFRRSGEEQWNACIVVDGKTLNLGQFLEEKNAALAYNKAAKLHFGRFAWLNPV